MKIIKEFIDDNREAIDGVIFRARNHGRTVPIECAPLTDDDREEWILNDDGLYLWALRKGVNLE